MALNGDGIGLGSSGTNRMGDGVDGHRSAAAQQDAGEISRGNDLMGVDSDGRGSVMIS